MCQRPDMELSARDTFSVPPSGVITLLTDFGNADGYVAAMKGVILTLNARACIVDLSHEIEPQNIAAAAFLLSVHYKFFPRGTVHVAIVDPGVGTARAAWACVFDGHYFVAPDNGLLDFCAAGEALAVKLTRPEYWRPELSHTFHGRDIFAPVAAHLTLGVPLLRLGERAQVAARHIASSCRIENEALVGEIIHCDRFGNLISNITSQDLQSFCGGQAIRIAIAGLRFERLLPSYGHVAAGQPVALLNSCDRLEIGVNQGHAAALFGLAAGAPILVTRGA